MLATKDICCDIGYKSVCHEGEQLCGDHVAVVPYGENSTVVVLADGLKSGVKASILSTLTSKIISTMMAAGIPIEECVETIVATLPVDSEKHVAYSTFTILQIINNEFAQIMQYDNPLVIFIRNGKRFNYPKKELIIGDKKIYTTRMRLRERDTFVLMSDGCPNASIGLTYNYNWQVSDIATFMETYCELGYTAKTLASMLTDECNRQYGYHPIDDATSCVVRMRERKVANLMFGTPTDPSLMDQMLADFLGAEGKKIISGSRAAEEAARHLKQTVKYIPGSAINGIPPLSEIAGIDLVTEGIITINQVREYAADFIHENTKYDTWGFARDGASMISRVLFEEATDINLYIGQIDTYYDEGENFRIGHNYQMHLIQEMESSLREMGKRVKLTYY